MRAVRSAPKASTRTWARVTDLGRSRCYVEMQATSPLNIAVNLVIEVNGMRVHAKGIGRTCCPLPGMGIAFTETPDVDGMRLEEIWRPLAGGSSPDPELESSAGPDLLMIPEVSAAPNAVAKFFQTHHALTREEFTNWLARARIAMEEENADPAVQRTATLSTPAARVV